MTAEPRITAVVNTLNAADHLANALASLVRWVSEIVVVDMHSDDSTRDIAASFGARVYLHERIGYVEPARAFAVAQATGDWIIVLDADEMVSPDLAAQLRWIAREGDVDVVDIPFANHLFGAPSRNGLFASRFDSHTRFFRKGSVALSSKMHEFAEVADDVRRMQLKADERTDMAHFSHLDVSGFLTKSNRYTTVKAAEMYSAATPVKGPMRAGLRAFLGCYLRKQGFRDGWRGWQTAWLVAIDRVTVQLKVSELRHGGGEQTALRDQAVRAAALLAAWSRHDLSDRAAG